MAGIIEAILSIFVAALVIGLIMGVGVKAGIEPSEEGVGLFILEQFCRATEQMENATPQICWSFYVILSVITVVGFLVSIREEITKVEDWRVGAITYFIGWMFGFLLIVAR